jgi:hypothetical protein
MIGTLIFGIFLESLAAMAVLNSVLYMQVYCTVHVIELLCVFIYFGKGLKVSCVKSSTPSEECAAFRNNSFQR